MIKKLLVPLLIIYSHSFYLHSMLSESSMLNSVHFSPDVSMVVLGSTSNIHNVYYFPEMTLAHAYAASNPCKCAKFSPNQDHLAFALNNYTLIIKDTINFSITSAITSTLNTIN